MIFRPAWRLNNGINAATDDQLEEAATSCEKWAWGCAILVVIGVAVEFGLAVNHPSYGSIREIWGTALADLLIGLGVAGEIVFARMGFSRQSELTHRSNKKLEDAHTRSALAQKRAEEASSLAARAMYDLAEANERAAALEVQAAQLRKQISPRHLNYFEFVEFVKGQQGLPVEIMFVKDDADAFTLSLEIRSGLRDAGWDAHEPIPIPILDQPISAQLPSTMTVGGQPSGVTVVAHSATPEEMMADSSQLSGKEWVKTPMTVLRNALLKSLGSISTHVGGQNPPALGLLRVVVGPKA